MPVDSNNGERAAQVARLYGLKGRYHQLVDEVITPVVVVDQLTEDAAPPAFGAAPGTEGGMTAVYLPQAAAGTSYGVQLTAGAVPIRLERVSITEDSVFWGIALQAPASTPVGYLANWRDIRPGLPSATASRIELTTGDPTSAPFWVIAPGWMGSAGAASRLGISVPAGTSVYLVPLGDGTLIDNWEVGGNGAGAIGLEWTE